MQDSFSLRHLLVARAGIADELTAVNAIYYFLFASAFNNETCIIQTGKKQDLKMHQPSSLKCQTFYKYQ
jgi:hypothetical protein